ncbi:MAG: lysophospholipid acyltransferase family protein [Acetobacteraceae bacterium]
MKLLHRVEGTAARAALAFLRRLKPERSSTLCGRVARAIGPLLPVSRIADINLRLALPELDAIARRRVIAGVWESLGRTVGEFPHVWRMTATGAGPGWTVIGGEHVDALVRQGGPSILFTGHISNWELLAAATVQRGLPIAALYRPAENPVIDDIILGLRRSSLGSEAKMFAKGAKGARQALSHLRAGGSIGLLPDQKMNDGIESRFFGLPAMTASALAALALRMNCPVVPACVERTAPARFTVTYEAPLALPTSGDRAADIAALTQAVNDRIEAWIRAKPESWLWLHRRWPKQYYADA